MAKLVDASGLGPDAVEACRFESDSPHHGLRKKRETLPSVSLFSFSPPQGKRGAAVRPLHKSVLVTATAAAGAFLVMMVMMLFTVMMMVVLAATALIFMVVMMFATAATTRFLVVMVMTAATAAAFLFGMMVVMAATAAAALFLVVVVPAAATAAFLFAVMVMMTAATATAATTAAACMTLDADGFEGLFDLGDLETDHAEHLGDVRERQNGEALGSFGHFDAAVDEGADGLLHRAQVARHVKNLFNGGTHDPELACVVNEDVVDEERALFLNGDGDHAFGRFKGVLPGHALGGRENELLGAGENGLGRGRFGRQELGKGRHFEFL